MPAKKKDDAPKAPAKKVTETPKADSSVTAPIEMETRPNASLPEPLVLDPQDVKNVAVQLAMAEGERRPYAMHIGRPMWMRWERFARAGLMAAAYLSTRKDRISGE